MTRRFLLLLIGVPLAAVPAFFAALDRREADRSDRLYARAPSGFATVLSKRAETVHRSKGSPTTYYYVTLEGPVHRSERRVDAAAWKDVVEGARTEWHADPRGGPGLSGLERSFRTNRTAGIVLLSLAIFAALLLGAGAWTGLPGGAAEGKARPGGPCPERTRPQLPPPERAPAPAWEAWLRRKYLSPAPLLGAMALPALLISVPAAALDAAELAVALTAWWLAVATAALLASWRGRRRDRLLWRRGEERHATLVSEKPSGAVCAYEAVYEQGGRTWTLRQRMPGEARAARVVDGRVIVLVDRPCPSRATLVPAEAFVAR